jgi:hypothetical protein
VLLLRTPPSVHIARPNIYATVTMGAVMNFWNPFSWFKELDLLRDSSTTFISYTPSKGNQRNHHCAECGAFVNPDMIACWRGHGL